MVSTRGGARTGADGQVETESKLPKKPVRKVATTTKTVKAAPAAKTTRPRKLETEHEDGEADELQDDRTAAAAKVTRKGRAKKDDANPTTAAPSRPAAASRARAAATATATIVNKKTATTRTARSSKPETATPDLPPPTQPKTARATRATASTRATAAKERAPPLSPKKITQVSKAPVRSARTTNVKAATGREEKKAAAKSRPAARQRGLSDENAGVPHFRPSTANQEGDEVNSKQSLEGKSAAQETSVKAVAELETIEIDNETPMSTRPTTPADSPRLDSDGDDDYHILQQEISDAESDAATELEISADELCGPKTPMKRLSPRERFKYTSSARKERGAEEIPLKTPAMRFQILGSQSGTPQTQKPYCKPRLPISDVRPTTVARARDRAMVFQKLQPLTLPRALEEADETANFDYYSASACIGHIAADTEGPEMFDISCHISAEDGEAEDPDSSMKELAGVLDDAESHSIVNGDVGRPEKIAFPFQMRNLTIVDAGGDNDDPNETMVMEDQEMGNSLDMRLDVSLGSEESVIVRHDMAAEADDSFTCDESVENSRLPTTPKPETIVWENLREDVREDVTIPFNFESILSASRTGMLGEPDEPLSLSSEEHVEVQQSSETVGSIAYEQRMPDVEIDMTLANTQYQRQGFGDVRMSVDATVNLSDFLDMSSLTEQPGQEFQVQASIDTTNLDVDAPGSKLDNGAGHLHDASMFMSRQHPATPIKPPSTPPRESLPELPSVPQENSQALRDPNAPHYAMPTIAFRRKSLPAVVYHTPMKSGGRPKTSDGASMPRASNPFTYMMAAEHRSQKGMSPFKRRLGTAQALGVSSRPQTPSAETPMATLSRATPRTSGRVGVTQTPRTSSRLSARSTPKERFPGLPSRQTYEELASTPTSKTPMQLMSSSVKSNMKERFPALPPAEKYEDLAKKPTSGHASGSTSVTPRTIHSIVSPFENDREMVQQEERYPGLPHRRTYEEHARTAMPASRFRTPSQSPAKRPATVQRPASLRKMALRATTPKGSRTPFKTPIRAPDMTPGQVPLTPHPAAPLRSVNAYVDVFLNDGSSANSTYIAVLHSLGAKTTKTFNDRVTHVIFKEGSPATLQRLRLHNKQVIDSAEGKAIFCVNGRWVNDCNSEGARMDEADEAYAVDIEDQRASKRRRKSMEPTSLLNIGGNVVRDTSRKSSLGRSSLSRALKAGSPPLESPSLTMTIDVAEKENSGDSSFGDESPATPAYLSAPDSLVQQTAPMNRVRKLDFDAQEQATNRRLTFWDGGEF